MATEPAATATPMNRARGVPHTRPTARSRRSASVPMAPNALPPTIRREESSEGGGAAPPPWSAPYRTAVKAYVPSRTPCEPASEKTAASAGMPRTSNPNAPRCISTCLRTDASAENTRPECGAGAAPPGCGGSGSDASRSTTPSGRSTRSSSSGGAEYDAVYS